MRRFNNLPANRLLIPAALAAALAGAALPALAETRSFDFEAFTGVDASAGVDVYVTAGEPQSVVVEQKDGKFEQLEIEVRDGVLHVSAKSEGWAMFGNRPPFKATVSVEMLDYVDVSSGADVYASGIDSEELRVDVSSGADAELAGRCGRLILDVSSGADADAEELICAEVQVDVSSGADATVHATDRVSADASSGADVTVYGKPSNVTTDSSSGGDVRIR